MNLWWIEPVAIISGFMVLLVCMAGAYWSMEDDGFDEPALTRRLVSQLFWGGCTGGVLMAAGFHTLSVPFIAAPGTWPLWADRLGRVIFTLSAGVITWRVLHNATRERPFSRLLLGGGLAMSAVLLVLGVWPWLPTLVPHPWLAGFCALMTMVAALLIRKGRSSKT